MMMHEDKRMDQYSGEHVEGATREREEEMRKNSNMGMFTPDSEGSSTRLQENHGNDRNK